MRGFMLFVVMTTIMLFVKCEIINKSNVTLKEQQSDHFKSGLILYNSFMDGFLRNLFGKRLNDVHLLKWFDTRQKNDNTYNFLKSFDSVINKFEGKNTVNKIMKTVQYYYKIAMENVEDENVADSLFDGVGSVFNFFDEPSSGHGQGTGGGGGPSFTSSIMKNLNYFYKSVTGFIGMSDMSNIGDLIFDQFSSMFDYASGWISAPNKPKIKKKIGRHFFYNLISKSDAVLNNFESAELRFNLSSDIVQIKLKHPSAASSNRQMQMQMKVPMTKIFQFLLFPALAMTGIMPYVLPPLKMGVMFVTTLTNMAFTTALISLVRGIIFDPDPSRRVVYTNYGYKKNRHPPFDRQN